MTDETTIVFESTTDDATVEQPDAIGVDYSFFRRPRNVVVFTIVGLILYYVTGFGFNFEALQMEGVSAGDFIAFLLIDQFLIESVSMALLFASILVYVRAFSIRRITLTGAGIVRYFIYFVPLALGVFFVINPVTQTLRFLLRHAGAYDWQVFLNAYLLDPSLYLTYTGILAPLLMLGLGLNLIIQLRERVVNPGTTSSDERFSAVVRAATGGFEKMLSCHDVSWFGVEDRTYHAVTDDGRYRITESLSDLEERLNPELFVRIRRSVIVNLAFVESYAHWKGGRYILHMQGSGDVEHVIPRERVREFKERMQAFCASGS